MPNFVTCAACGARIQSDRDRCLRCNQILVAAPEPPRIQKLTGIQQRLMAGAAVIAILMVGALAWLNRPESIHDDAQADRPAPSLSQTAAAPASAPSAPGADRSNSVAAPGEFLDLSRSATAAYLSGDLQKARQQFESALERKPDDPEALNNIGQILDRQGDVAGAIERFELAIKLAPDRWAYHFNLAHAVGRQGDWERAIEEYREAARLFPEDYATQFNLALALHRVGNYPAAIVAFEAAIQLAPAEASFHLALGNTLQAAGRLPEARKAFETYLKMEPNAPDAGKVKAHVQALTAATGAQMPRRRRARSTVAGPRGR